MSDFLLVAGIPILLVLLVGIYQAWSAWLERPDCDHRYDRWHDFHETHYAYVQKRTCQKCGYTQTLEHKKITYESTATTQASNKRFWQH